MDFPRKPPFCVLWAVHFQAKESSLYFRTCQTVWVPRQGLGFTQKKLMPIIVQKSVVYAASGWSETGSVGILHDSAGVLSALSLQIQPNRAGLLGFGKLLEWWSAQNSWESFGYGKGDDLHPIAKLVTEVNDKRVLNWILRCDAFTKKHWIGYKNSRNGSSRSHLTK